ncbi:MAG: hypothetical protein DWQ31_14385 [Planctomycetota bacterium]|nr:MAG: hypothetical protein DWQ31_14385 [Planctomycetota bacterium]REJ94555.1 MAG: hypothetical protein DWQ35_08090 [Planctomycetota bacterium]REK18583.1 MAG: hypothetical protein DWQ42_19380 [Planctomycetota bacterium]REK37478.1 MAG: hypothetical protein DWQ46_21855 [Planctomycetota bacterium]
MLRTWRPFALLLAANVVCVCVLSFYGRSEAAPREATGQFANAIAQRQEIIEELKAIHRLIAEQNRLLQSGEVNVTIAEDNQN